MKGNRLSLELFSTVLALVYLSAFPLFSSVSLGVDCNATYQHASIQSADAKGVVQAGEQIGSADGRIYVIPTLSSQSCKNEERLIISAVVKARAGVREVVADIGGIETIPLKPAPANAGAVNALGTLGLYTAEWSAHNLEQKAYHITIGVTDATGHVFEDSSLSFSDPVAGHTSVGSTNYPSYGLKRIGAEILRLEAPLTCAIIDTSKGYAYFGTWTMPGVIIKGALGSGSSPPTRVGCLVLDSQVRELLCAVIDASAGYAYFGTNTDPGIVVKVALGSGSNPPTRVGTLTLNAGEDYLKSAVIDTAARYALFGNWTLPGKVVKINLESGSNPPTRVGAVTLNPGENYLLSAVIDSSAGYAYFGTNTMPGRLIKLAYSQKNYIKATKMNLAEGA